jgi:hypothetical protein
MSNEARDWAWQQPTRNIPEKCVLVALAQFADREGRKVYPGIARLAAMVGSSERNVQYILRSLEAQKLIFRENDGGGRGNPTRYRLAINGAEDCTLSEPKRGNGLHPLGHAAPRERVQSSVIKGAIQRQKGCNPLHPTPNDSVKDSHKVRERAPAAPTPPARLPLPLPRDFEPDEQAVTLALSLGVDLARAVRMFLNHFGPGDERRPDWQATFRLWLDREHGYAPGRGNNGASGNGWCDLAASLRAMGEDAPGAELLLADGSHARH